MPPIARPCRRREMTVIAHTRRCLQQTGPCLSLILVFVPLLLVEPLKLAALVLAGKGHWISGTGILVAAYAVSLLFVERLFKVLKPKLMTLNWFAKSWTWVTAIRDGAWAWLRWRTLKNGLGTLKVRRSKS
jgi:hypothetical protein